MTNPTFPFTTAKPPVGDTFHWGLFILFVFLAGLLGIILSKWGWTRITGRIWRMSSGWEGPLEMLDDEVPLIEGSGLEMKNNVTVNVSEVSPSCGSEEHDRISSDIEHRNSVEEWIVAHSQRI
jgi:hypothetical protein